jgi:viologen exporter family transport system permease protein
VGTRWRAFLAGWRLALRIAGLCFSAELEYRADFVISIVFGVAWQTSVIIFVTVLLGSFRGMGGWPSHAVLLIAAMRMLSHGVYAVLFDRNYQLATMVQDGRLEAFMLRPMPVYRQVQLSVFPTNALGDLLVGVSLFAWAVGVVGLHWTPWRVAYLAAGLAGGVLIEAAIATVLASFLLRYPATSAWNMWIEELLGTFGNYPLSFLPRLIGGAFTFVLPLAFIAYFPAAVLTGHTGGLGVPAAVAAAAPLVGLLAFAGARLLWNARLRHYTGVTG